MLNTTASTLCCTALAFFLSSFPSHTPHLAPPHLSFNHLAAPPAPPTYDHLVALQCPAQQPDQYPATASSLLKIIHAAQAASPSFSPSIAAFSPNPSLPPHHPCNAYTIPSPPSSSTPLLSFSSQLETIHPDAAAFALALEIAASLFQPPPPRQHSPFPSDITQASIERLLLIDKHASLLLLASDINPFEAAKIYFLQTLGHPAIHNPLVDIDTRLHNIALTIPL